MRGQYSTDLLADAAINFPGRGLEVQANKPLRQGGVRLPAIVRWPERLKPGTVCSEVLSSLAILPVLAAAAGGQPQPGLALDGCDPLPTSARRAASPHPALCRVWNQGSKQQWKALRAGRWKILQPADNEPWGVFDVSADPGEANNLAGANAAQVRKLVAEFNRRNAGVFNDPGRSVSARE